MQKYYLALLKAIVKISAAFLIVFENWKKEKVYVAFIPNNETILFL